MKKVWQPLESGNPQGRPPGVPNKVTGRLREAITDFLEDNFAQVQKNFNLLAPKDQAKLYCDLLQYGLPRLQSIALKQPDHNTTPNFDLTKLTEDELKTLIALQSKCGISEEKNA